MAAAATDLPQLATVRLRISARPLRAKMLLSHCLQRGRRVMRFIFGIIVGAALTIGGAYVSDTSKSGADSRRMVNWDVVGQNVDALTVFIKQSWAKLTS
jgi:hypothetical protein